MLNYKGVYYTKEILKDLNVIKDKLFELKILKTNDLGEHTNLSAISASISTDFISTELPAIIVKGYSENIKDSFYYMGEENLVNIPEAAKYYEDLKKIYESGSNNKGFEYFKLFFRSHYAVSKSLKDALVKAERREGVPSRRKGSSFTFETSLDNIAVLSGMRDDYSKMGLKYPVGEGKFIQIDGNDMYRGKITSAANVNPSNVTVPVIVNIPYNDEKEIAKKIYSVVSTYKGRPIEVVEMIPGSELIEILKSEYKANESNSIVDLEPFYEQAEKMARQSLQSVVYFVTGKNKAYRVIDCQKQGEWPISILKANTMADLGNATLFTKRGFDLVQSRKNEKNQQASRKLG